MRVLVMRKFLTLFLALGTILSATNFFPLGQGNRWTLKAENGAELEIRTGMQFLQHGGEFYWWVSGFDSRPYWMRMTADQELMTLVVEEEAMALARRFGPPGSHFTTQFAGCPAFAQVSEKRVEWVSNGRSLQALQVLYEGGCPDNSLAEELYVENVGLVKRVVNTLIGPVSYHLKEAVVGNLVFRDQSGTTVDLSTPNTRLTLDGTKLSVPVQLRLATRGAEPLRLRFIDGQRYDFVLRNERGEAVWRWSDGKVFIQAASEERVTDKSWSEVLEMTVPGPGEYRLEGRLTTVGDPIVAAAVTIRVY